MIAERGVIGTRIADVAERRHLRAGASELAQLPGPRERLARIVELWPAEGDGEAVLWMELWVRALRDPEVNAARGTA